MGRFRPAIFGGSTMKVEFYHLFYFLVIYKFSCLEENALKCITARSPYFHVAELPIYCHVIHICPNPWKILCPRLYIKLGIQSLLLPIIRSKLKPRLCFYLNSMAKRIRKLNSSWIEVAPAPFIFPHKPSTIPKLETIDEKRNEGANNGVTIANCFVNN